MRFLMRKSMWKTQNQREDQVLKKALKYFERFKEKKLWNRKTLNLKTKK